MKGAWFKSANSVTAGLAIVLATCSAPSAKSGRSLFGSDKSSRDGSGSINQDSDPAAMTDNRKSQDPEYCKTHSCQTDSSDTQIAGANLLDYTNARVGCDFANLGQSNYTIFCRATVVTQDGQSQVPTGIAPGVDLSWQQPTIQSGIVPQLDCQVSENKLAQTCTVRIQSASVAINLGLNVTDESHKTPRVESASILLPFSVGISAGLVMSGAQFYQSSLAIPSLTSTSPPIADGTLNLGFQPALNLLGTSTNIGAPTSMCAVGKDLYIASESYSIFKLSEGNLTLYAGSATASNKNNFSFRLRVALGGKSFVACSDKTIFVSDFYNNRILGVSLLDGTVSLIAGNSVKGFSGDGGNATLAQLNGPRGMAVASDQSLYFADTLNHRIRKVDSKGIITTIAGTGSSTWIEDKVDSPILATAATLNLPHAVALGTDKSLYIADTGNHRIRKIDANGFISTLAGTGTAGYTGDGGPASQAKLNGPSGITVGIDQNLYIADSLNNVIRKVDAKMQIETFAGNGSAAYGGDGGLAKNASLNLPAFTYLNSDSTLYIADAGNYRIRAIDSKKIISLSIGDNNRNTITQPASAVSISAARGLAIDNDMNVYFSDWGNHLIRNIDKSGTSSRIAGNFGVAGNNPDGTPALDANFTKPMGIYIDDAKDIYVADSGNNTIRKISASGITSTIAGNAQVARGYSGDKGPATEAKLSQPSAIVVAKDHTIYIADEGNFVIRKIDPNGQISTVANIAGNGQTGMALSQDQKFYFAGDKKDIKILDNGVISSFTSYSSTNLTQITGMGFGPKGELYVTDGSQVAILEPVAGKSPKVTTIFNTSNYATGGSDCGIGKVNNQATSFADLTAKIQTSLGIICAGTKINALAVAHTCDASDPAKRNFSIVFSQLFVAGSSNIVQIQKPCGD